MVIGIAMKIKLKALCIFAVTAFGVSGVKGQDAAVKTNLLYDAALTVNLGVEFGLAPRWTLDVSGNFNGWTLSHDRRWKHWLLQPEARYWFCDRFSGHFLGAHAHGGQYNARGLKNNISFLAAICPNSPIIGTRAGSSVRVWPTVTPGFWAGTGISKPSWAWGMPIRAMTSSAVWAAARNSNATSPIIMSAPRSWRSIWFTYFKIEHQ